MPVEALPLELERLRPAELLLPPDVPLPDGLPTAVTRLQDGAAPGSQCRQVLLDHFQAVTLAGLGLEGLEGAASASGAILVYLAENGPGVLPFITRLTVYSPDDHMVLDGITVRNLEVFLPLQKEGRSLLATIDLTKTAMGSRLLRRWLGQPLLDVSEINETSGPDTTLCGLGGAALPSDCPSWQRFLIWSACWGEWERAWQDPASWCPWGAV